MTTTRSASELIIQRARHFGQGVKHGGWLFAADVACCVERGGKTETAHSASSKVSIRKFAELGGVERRSATTVLYYLKAWDAAARDGLVTPAAELTPGDSPDLPDAARWTEYYQSQRLGSAPGRQAAINRQAQADGISATTVGVVVRAPSALRAAILADDATAEAAFEALVQRGAREGAGRVVQLPAPDEPDDEADEPEPPPEPPLSPRQQAQPPPLDYEREQNRDLTARLAAAIEQGDAYQPEPEPDDDDDDDDPFGPDDGSEHAMGHLSRAGMELVRAARYAAATPAAGWDDDTRGALAEMSARLRHKHDLFDMALEVLQNEAGQP
jgi:hypothetical protein